MTVNHKACIQTHSHKIGDGSQLLHSLFNTKTHIAVVINGHGFPLIAIFFGFVFLRLLFPFPFHSFGFLLFHFPLTRFNFLNNANIYDLFKLDEQKTEITIEHMDQNFCQNTIRWFTLIDARVLWSRISY